VSIALRSTLVSEAYSLFDTCLLPFALHWCLRRIPCSTSVYCPSLYIGVWGMFPVRQVSIALRSTLVSEACSLFDKCLLPFALHWCLRRVPCSTSVYWPSLYIGVWGVFPVRQVYIALRSTLLSDACALFDKCILRFVLHWCLRHVPCSTSVYWPSLYIGVWGVFPVRQVSIALRSTLVFEACSLFDKCLLRFALHWCVKRVPCSTSVYCALLYINLTTSSRCIKRGPCLTSVYCASLYIGV
jgi:hypothetical protein